MSFKNYVISLRGAIQPIFLNKNGGLYKGLLKAFTKVWVHMGLSKPAPTFMALRTSMSTQVSVNYDTHCDERPECISALPWKYTRSTCSQLITG